MTLYQDCSSHHDSSKNLLVARGRGLFSLYSYIENFKTLLVRDRWTDFNITWQKCFFGNPLRAYVQRVFVIRHKKKKKKRHGHQGQDLFSLYNYIESFKLFLSEIIGPISLDHEVSICSLIPPAMAISIARTTKGNNYKGPGPTALIFFPTIQLVILVMCTKFQDSRYSSPWEIFDIK